MRLIFYCQLFRISKECADQYSLFTVSDPNVLVCAVNPVEEDIDKRIILRVWNMSDKDSNCALFAANEILRCNQMTHIEFDGDTIIPVSGIIKATIGHNRIQTFRFFLK